VGIVEHIEARAGDKQRLQIERRLGSLKSLEMLTEIRASVTTEPQLLKIKETKVEKKITVEYFSTSMKQIFGQPVHMCQIASMK
jgi:hypothetical protein